ncbi:MAG: diphosphomevalonate decarboxylase [Flexilinea sp.]|nr:diphosphomevalonate decarboxylase [Flexilinea sp.]
MTGTATAIAHPNIAFIKYWGNRDDALRLPANGSISMNLAELHTQTSVSFRDDLRSDILTIDGKEISGAALARVKAFMDQVRRLAPDAGYAEIVSKNNFPIGVGIASSAAAFSALALAAARAAGLNLKEKEYSRLARLGSGSACRSVPDGFCEWNYGSGDEDSFAVSISPASHWGLIDLIALISDTHKKVGSSAGHVSALTSPFQSERIRTAPERIAKCRQAILEKDFKALAEVSEQDMIMMHSVMMTQDPPLFYWEPLTIRVIKAVHEWREEGLDCFATIDAGPNVHVICTAEAAPTVREQLVKIKGIREILSSGPGGKAELL